MKTKLKSRIENWFKEILIEGKRPASPFFLFLFSPFSYLFKIGSFIFHLGYDRGFFKQQKAEAFICSIGNIVLGGVGKTPLILLIGKTLQDKIPLGIISRGYTSPLEKTKAPFLLSKDKGPVISACHAGDEPYLLASKLPKGIVVVGKNRVLAAKLCHQYGAKLILLDDGMQHRKIKRDFEIVVLDGQNLFGNTKHFPCGLLREAPTGLKRADLLVVNHAGNELNLDELEAKIRVYSQAPLVFTKYILDEPYELLSLKPIELNEMPVALFAAIGNPLSFKNMIGQKGADIKTVSFLHDHAPICRADLNDFALQAKKLGSKLILVTEKDSVKINKNWQIALPIAVAPISIEIIKGEEHWKSALNQLLKLSFKKIS